MLAANRTGDTPTADETKPVLDELGRGDHYDDRRSNLDDGLHGVVVVVADAN